VQDFYHSYQKLVIDDIIEFYIPIEIDEFVVLGINRDSRVLLPSTISFPDYVKYDEVDQAFMVKINELDYIDRLCELAGFRIDSNNEHSKYLKRYRDAIKYVNAHGLALSRIFASYKYNVGSVPFRKLEDIMDPKT